MSKVEEGAGEVSSDLTIKDCHCGSPAIRYRIRRFENHFKHKVNRHYYRCTNCLSRISHDVVSELDEGEKFNVFDHLKCAPKEGEKDGNS